MTMTLVATTTLGSNASNIEFTNIPQTGTDLLILFSGRDTGTGATRNLLWSVNGSTSNYSFRTLWGNGSSTGSQNSTTLGVSSIITTNPGAVIPGSGSTTSTFSNIAIYVSGYTSSLNKSFSFNGVGENNSSTAFQVTNAALLSNTAAITSFKLEADNTFAAGSMASIYTITKA